MISVHVVRYRGQPFGSQPRDACARGSAMLHVAYVRREDISAS